MQVWAVVVLSREVSTQGTTIANTNPALVDKSGATLRTTGGVINLIDMPKNATAAAESFASVPLNSTAFGRRLLQAGAGMTYSRDIADEDVNAGCQLMLDGQKTFTSIQAGVDDTAVVSVVVEGTSGKSCAAAVSSSAVAGLQANLNIDGVLGYVDCTASTCKLFAIADQSQESGGADSGRRLLSVEHQKVTITFDDQELLCSHGGCELLHHNHHSRSLNQKGRCAYTPVCWVTEKPNPNGQCNCVSRGGSRCFPADALVTTPAGPKRIGAITIGDQVLAVQPDGSTSYNDVVFFGHKDATTEAQFVKLATTSDASLRLTPDHHLPVIRNGARMVIPSDSARVGDFVHIVQGKSAVRLEAIISKTLVPGVGLYNPYTTSGLIVVDGVSASCHSSWILDGLFKMMGVSLSSGYQAVFAPIRAVYSLIGAKRMTYIEFVIDLVAERTTRENFSMSPLLNSLAWTTGVMAVFLASRKHLAV